MSFFFSQLPVVDAISLLLPVCLCVCVDVDVDVDVVWTCVCVFCKTQMPPGVIQLDPSQLGTGGTPAYQGPEVLKYILIPMFLSLSSARALSLSLSLSLSFLSLLSSLSLPYPPPPRGFERHSYTVILNHILSPSLSLSLPLSHSLSLTHSLTLHSSALSFCMDVLKCIL